MKHYDAFEAERIDRIVDQENLRAETVEGGVEVEETRGTEDKDNENLQAEGDGNFEVVKKQRSYDEQNTRL